MWKRSITLLFILFSLCQLSSSLMGPPWLAGRARKAMKSRFETNNPEFYANGESKTKYSISYYSQTVDHFNYGTAEKSSQKFQMRYLYNGTYWGGAATLAPIFVYCGNEGDITGFWNNSGSMVDYMAPQFGAYLLFPEHRYFGNSLPFGQDSLNKTNLVYLTADQAMADFAVFIHDYKTNTLKCPQCPVITFGGSYGGMLAAWMRMKYPQHIDGALAASAPVLYFNDVVPEEGFFEITSWDFGNCSAVPNCAQMIKEGFNRMDKYIHMSGGLNYQLINRVFNTCTPLTSNANISAVEDWLTNAYTYMAMVDYPYPTSFLTPMPGNPVNFSCLAFSGLNKTVSDEVIFTAMFKAANIFYNYENASQCNEVFYDSSGLGDLADQAWGVLACTEVILPMGSNGMDDIFPARPWSYAANTKYCQDTYGVQSRYDWALNEFGGWNATYDFTAYSNIFWSNGVLDPWHAGGVLQNISYTQYSYVIKGAAHHLDLRSPNILDPLDVQQARLYEAGYITTWIKKKQEAVLGEQSDFLGFIRDVPDYI